MVYSKEIKDAFLLLAKVAWDKFRDNTHKDDLPKYEKAYNKFLKDYEASPSSYITDTMSDIRCYFS